VVFGLAPRREVQPVPFGIIGIILLAVSSLMYCIIFIVILSLLGYIFFGFTTFREHDLGHMRGDNKNRIVLTKLSYIVCNLQYVYDRENPEYTQGYLLGKKVPGKKSRKKSPR